MFIIGKDLGAAFLWVIIAIVMFVAMLMQIYTALAIGHQWSAHRILGSVIAYFGIDLLKNIIGGILAKIGYYTGLGEFLEMQIASGEQVMWKIQTGILVTTVVLIAIYSFVTWFLLDKKLNLE